MGTTFAFHEQSMARQVVRSLADPPTWEAVHLEYSTSGKTGKFYRIYICASEQLAFCQWGSRPADLSPHFGNKGQIKVIDPDDAQKLLFSKLAKGYHRVLEVSCRAPNENPSLVTEYLFGGKGKNISRHIALPLSANY